MSNIGFVGVNADFADTGTYIVTMSPPTGVSANQLLIAAITWQEITTVISADVVPTGWYEISSSPGYNDVTNYNVKNAFYYKVATTADTTASDYTWNFDDNTNDVKGNIFAYSGCDTTNPIMTCSAINGGIDSRNQQAPQLVLSQPTRFIEFQAVNGFNTLTSAALTSRSDQTGNGACYTFRDTNGDVSGTYKPGLTRWATATTCSNMSIALNPIGSTPTPVTVTYIEGKGIFRGIGRGIMVGL